MRVECEGSTTPRRNISIGAPLDLYTELERGHDPKCVGVQVSELI